MGTKGKDPDDRPVRLGIYLNAEKRKALRHAALEEGIPTTQLVGRLLDEYLARRTRKEAR